MRPGPKYFMKASWLTMTNITLHVPAPIDKISCLSNWVWCVYNHIADQQFLWFVSLMWVCLTDVNTLVVHWLAMKFPLKYSPSLFISYFVRWIIIWISLGSYGRRVVSGTRRQKDIGLLQSRGHWEKVWEKGRSRLSGMAQMMNVDLLERTVSGGAALSIYKVTLKAYRVELSFTTSRMQSLAFRNIPAWKFLMLSILCCIWFTCCIARY